MKRFLSNIALLWLAVVTVCSATGCRSAVRVTDTPQTGSQQLLLDASVDAAVRCIDFSPLAERRVFLDAAKLEDAGDGYLVYRIREEMGLSGVRLALTRDEADVIVEAGLAAYGTDSHSAIVGVTETDQFPGLNLYSTATNMG